MTTLITGASGLIGSHLCRTLSENRADIVGLCHSRLISVRGNLRVDVCYLTDWFDLRSIFDKYQPDTVFHFAAHLPSTATNMVHEA